MGELHRMLDMALHIRLPGALYLDIKMIRKNTRPALGQLLCQSELIIVDGHADITKMRAG